MTTPATKLTYRDYLLLPDDGKRYEILEGELYASPSPGTRHQLIAFRLSQDLWNISRSASYWDRTRYFL